MTFRCRVQEVIGVLVELGFPPELARDLVYKWKAVEHPAAIALKTDPWLRRVQEQFKHCGPDGRYHNVMPTTTHCVCPCNHTEGKGFNWEKNEHIHRVLPGTWWPMVGQNAKIWRERIDGPHGIPRVVMSVKCPRLVLCMRYFRHTMPVIGTKIGLTALLDQGGYGYADGVTNTDHSLATWLRYAPLSVLEEYLKGVTGWTEKKMVEQLDTRFGAWHINRQDIVKMCLEY